MTIPINLLASATLGNVKIKNFNRKKGTAKLKFDDPSNVLFFQDRPGIETFSVNLENLTSKKSWNSIFGKEASFHTLLGETNDLVDIRMSKPRQISGDTYSAKIYMEILTHL